MLTLIPVKSPVFNRSLLFFGLHFTCLLFFSCFFLVSCFSPVFLENKSKATLISCFSSSSAQIYLNSYCLARNSALLACLNNTQLTQLNPACPKVAITLDNQLTIPISSSRYVFLNLIGTTLGRSHLDGRW